MRTLVLWALAACAMTGCLLFTERINQPPTVEIDGPTRVRRGASVAFQARVMDDDGQPTRAWYSGPTCPGPLDEAAAGTPVGTGEQLTVTATSADPFCVWVVVTDHEGSRAMASRKVEVATWTVSLRGPDRARLGERLTFEAQLEGEAAPLKATWSWQTADSCPTGDAAVVGAQDVGGCDAATCTFSRTVRRPFCALVRARDELGVEARATHAVTEIVGNPPVAQLDLIAPKDPMPLGIGTLVRVSGAASRDPDPDDTLATLTFNFKVTASPDQRTIEPETCPAPRAAIGELCFRTGNPGTYQVALEVQDRSLASATATSLTIQVDDLPPCIVDSEPAFPAARKVFPSLGESYTFKVGRVQDDGDPYPAVADGGGQFVWWLLEPGVMGPLRKQFGFLNQFTLEANKYHIGDQLLVRAQYLDRVFLRDPAARELRSRCDIDAQSCELRSGCYQWVTWTVQY